MLIFIFFNKLASPKYAIKTCFSKKLMKNNLKTSLSLKLSFLIFSMVLNSMGIVILQLSANKISFSSLGLLETFKDLPIAITSLFAVKFINRYGTKTALMASLSIVSICCFILPFVEIFWFYKIWFAIIGVCFAVSKISVFGIIKNEAANENLLAKLMTGVESYFMIGIFLVNISFGWLISSSYSAYWKMGFLPIAILALFTIFLIKGTSIKETESYDIKFGLKEMKKLLNYKTVLFFFTLFFIVFIEQNFNSWLPSFYKKHLNVNSFFALQASAFLALFSFLGRIFTSYLIKNFNLNRYFISCLVALLFLLVFSQIILLYFENFNNLLLFLLPVAGLFLAPLYPLINSKMITKINEKEVHLFTSMIVIFSSFGSSFGSIIMSQLFQNNSGNYYPILISFIVLLLMVISFSFFNIIDSTKEKIK